MTGMLSPYVVLDFTDERGELGPMLLGDLGAEVIRVEMPGGSRARQAPPFASNGESLQFLAFNRNKKSIVLDPALAADQEVLTSLIQRADFLFESATNVADDYGFDKARIAILNPNIVHVRLGAYGSDGPHADLEATDLTIVAMAGPVALQGNPERAPVRISVPQVWRHAGAEAAAGAMVAHARMRRTGGPQFVDVSAQSTMTWTMLNAMDAYAIQGHEFERTSGSLNQQAGKVELVHPASDGYVVAIPHARVLHGCLEQMIAEGLAEAELRELDWVAYDQNQADPETRPMSFAEGTVILRRFFAAHTRRELFQFGLANDVTIAPINTLAELLAMPHMAERNYWQETTVGELPVRSAGAWAKPSTGGLVIENAAPALDEHGAEIRQSLPAPGKPSESRQQDDELPFAGLKVADFAWVGVGPISSKYLADHGASVVRVESEGRPDVLRGGLPMKDNIAGWNRSQFYGDFNTSKKSITINMKSAAGIELARKLIAESDVLIESFTPGTIARMGLGYEDVKAINPGLIMISTCLMGQTGPAASLAGYGYHAAAIAGFYEITGWPDEPPSAPWIAYTDTIAPRFVSLLLAAALDHRRRTGEGCYIDVAQIETALHFLGPELLDLQVNGYAATRMGNRSRFSAPCGVYPCQEDDRWCAIEVADDSQWQALCDVIDRPDWRADPNLLSQRGRASHQDEIDQVIAAWTAALPMAEVMSRLQAAGVPAGIVQQSRDLLSDPQYQHRGFYRYLDHTEMGNIPYAGHQYRIAGYDSGPRSPAPCIGEHSFEVLSGFLGLGDEEIAEAYANGAIN